MSDLIVTYDLETDGVDVRTCQVTQIAAVATDGELVRGELDLLVRFDVNLASPQALMVNHYDPDRWAEEAVSLDSALETFAEFCSRFRSEELTSRQGKAYTVAKGSGWNVTRFDREVLWRLFAPGNGVPFLPLSPYDLDVMELAKWYGYLARTPFTNYRLETIAASFGVEYKAHDALGDVHATIAVRELLTDRICSLLGQAKLPF